MRISAFLLASAVFAATAHAQQQGGQLDGNISLYTTFAALDAAGMMPDAESASNHPLRKALREAVLRKNPAVLAEIKTYFTENRMTVGQAVSFSLVSSGPPNFTFRYRDLDLPPEVTPFQELPAMLAKFYEQAEIDVLWKQSQRAYDQAIERYHEPVSQTVLEINSYLRNPTSGVTRKRFQIYLDLVGAPNQIHARNFGDDWFLVLTQSAEPQIDDVRRAYLTYVCDAIAMRSFTALQGKRALIDYARAAPALSDYYKADFVLLTIGSLVRAIEARLVRRPSVAENALLEGFILVPLFSELLPAYEKQEAGLAQVFPEWVPKMDLKREEERLANIDFVKEAVERRAKRVDEQPPPLVGAEKTLDDAETLYEKRNLAAARSAYTKVLTETDSKPLHAKAYYGLARVAILQRDPELGEKLFQQSLELGPDPYTKGWVLVYLGRVAHGYGEEEKAVERYKEAMAVEGASMAAKKAAEKGLIESQKVNPK